MCQSGKAVRQVDLGGGSGLAHLECYSEWISRAGCLYLIGLTRDLRRERRVEADMNPSWHGDEVVVVVSGAAGGTRF